MNSGRTFVAAVTSAAVDYIASKTK